MPGTHERRSEDILDRPALMGSRDKPANYGDLLQEGASRPYGSPVWGASTVATDTLPIGAAGRLAVGWGVNANMQAQPSTGALKLTFWLHPSGS